MTQFSPSGVYAIAATPFLPNGAIDWASVDTLTDFYLNCGVDGLTILGIMGEAGKLDAQESLELAARIITRVKGLPIIVGVSNPSFAAMRALAREAIGLGAKAVMIAPPNHLRTDESILTYFKQAVEAIGEDIPFVLQDYPLLLSVQMTPKLIRAIVQECPSCIMLKHEDWPGLEKITQLRGFEKEGTMRHLPLLTGNGGLFLDFEMARGADGANTGYAYPDMLVQLVKFAKAGERDKAHDLFDAHLPLLRYEQQPNIGLSVRKYILQKRGAITYEMQRKPGGTLTTTAKQEVDYLMQRLEKKLASL
jgi:4-hydroxy-tetrahydrodipicolinate synthase